MKPWEPSNGSDQIPGDNISDLGKQPREKHLSAASTLWVISGDISVTYYGHPRFSHIIWSKHKCSLIVVNCASKNTSYTCSLNLSGTTHFRTRASILCIEHCIIPRHTPAGNSSHPVCPLLILTDYRPWTIRGDSFVDNKKQEAAGKVGLCNLPKHQQVIGLLHVSRN